MGSCHRAQLLRAVDAGAVRAAGEKDVPELLVDFFPCEVLVLHCPGAFHGVSQNHGLFPPCGSGHCRGASRQAYPRRGQGRRAAKGHRRRGHKAHGPADGQDIVQIDAQHRCRAFAHGLVPLFPLLTPFLPFHCTAIGRHRNRNISCLNTHRPQSSPSFVVSKSFCPRITVAVARAMTHATMMSMRPMLRSFISFRFSLPST